MPISMEPMQIVSIRLATITNPSWMAPTIQLNFPIVLTNSSFSVKILHSNRGLEARIPLGEERSTLMSVPTSSFSATQALGHRGSCESLAMVYGHKLYNPFEVVGWYRDFIGTFGSSRDRGKLTLSYQFWINNNPNWKMISFVDLIWVLGLLEDQSDSGWEIQKVVWNRAEDTAAAKDRKRIACYFSGNTCLRFEGDIPYIWL